jgi:hypothetical protein
VVGKKQELKSESITTAGKIKKLAGRLFFAEALIG